jgi:hypothetical protein
VHATRYELGVPCPNLVDGRKSRLLDNLIDKLTEKIADLYSLDLMAWLLHGDVNK